MLYNIELLSFNQKRSLFADMKNANLDEKEMFETFKLWKKLNPTKESTD